MEAPPRRRLGRIVLRVALGAVGLLLLAVLAAVVVLTNLDHPWVKARVRAASGYEQLDYRVAKLRGLSGLRVEGFVIPELVRLENLDVTWSLFDLPRIEAVTARGVAVTIVPKPAAEPEPPTSGLSRQLADLMHGPAPVSRVEVTDVSVDMPREKTSVAGLSLTAQTDADGPNWKVHVTLGPGELKLARAEQQATVKLLLDADLTSTEAVVSLEADAVDLPALPVKDLLRAKARARFEPDQHRVLVDVEPSRLAGVANLEGALVLPDDPNVPPVLTRGTADARLAPVLALLPAGTVPFTLEDGELHLAGENVTLTAVPTGTLKANVTATQVKLAPYEVGSVKLDLTAQPQVIDATLGFERAVTPDVRLPSGELELHGRKLVPAPASLARVAGDVQAKLTLASVTAAAASAETVHLDLTAPLPQRGPFSFTAGLTAGRLRVPKRLDAPLKLELSVHDADPTQKTGSAKAEVDLGKLHLTLDATKGVDEVGYTYHLDAPELGIIGPAWAPLAAVADSTGRVTRLGSDFPHVEHRTTLAMPRISLDPLEGRDLTLTVHSKGDVLQHEGEAELKLSGLRTAEKDLGAQHVSATAMVNRRKLMMNASVSTKAGPKLSLTTALAWDGKKRVLATKLEGSVKDAEGAGPLLAALKVSPALDTSKLQGTFLIDGVLSGVVEGVTSAGELRLAKAPEETGGFDGTAALDLSGFRWNADGRGAVVPQLKWRAELKTDGPRRSVHSTLELERLVLLLGEKRVIATNVAQDLTASLNGGALTLAQRLDAATLEQRPAPLPVPVKNVTLSLSGDGRLGGVVKLTNVELTSPETKTTLALRGNLDLTNQRRQLALRGNFKQDLGALKLPDLYEGRGEVDLAFRVASPDLEMFRTRSKLRLKGVSVKLPDSDVEVENLEGEVVINESVELGDDGLRLTREIDANPYSMLRYADQHPLLSQNSFITAERISTEYGVIAPFAGNLAIEQNVVALSQLELGIRGGRVTGQCMLDLQGKATTLEAHVRATGVQSSRGEPFDGNAALVISAKDRSVNGRAEILRIGTQHLRDLLDIQDPQHLDPSLNRIRNALTIGYPDHLRLVFDHGFASMKISFGGAARLLKVDDVRGIPVGPLVSRALSSVSLPE